MLANLSAWLEGKVSPVLDSLNFLITVTSFLAPQITSNTMLAHALKFKLLVYFIY